MKNQNNSIRTKTGKFAKKTSSLYRFCKRTGLDENAYYEWAKLCGMRASLSYKDRQICELIGIEAIHDLQSYKPIDCEGLQTVGELNQFILTECLNPADLAASYLEMLTLQDVDTSADGLIDAHLTTTTKASFERWGDVNRLSDVSPSWFEKTGTPLDVQAMNISESVGREITENDMVEYLTTYRKNKYKSTSKLIIEQYEARFEQLTGFRLTEKYAEHLRAILNGDTEQVEAASEELETVDF
jgi:hypothetical protein